MSQRDPIGWEMNQVLFNLVGENFPEIETHI